MANIDLAQLLGVFQNVRQLFLEKSRFFVGQIDPCQFRHVSDIEIGCFGHGSKMETIEQPNGRYQKRNDQNEEDNAAFAALFGKRTAGAAWATFAVAFVLPPPRTVGATP